MNCHDAGRLRDRFGVECMYLLSDIPRTTEVMDVFVREKICCCAFVVGYCVLFCRESRFGQRDVKERSSAYRMSVRECLDLKV